jgi:hypothetical protein
VVSHPTTPPTQENGHHEPHENSERPARGRYRFREHTIRPDLRPEAEPITSRIECATCGAAGPTSEDWENGTAWAAQHLKANPGHLGYREHITRPYWFEPGAWQ